MTFLQHLNGFSNQDIECLCAVGTEPLKMTQVVLGFTNINKTHTAYVILAFVFIFIILVLQINPIRGVHLYVRILFFGYLKSRAPFVTLVNKRIYKECHMCVG